MHCYPADAAKLEELQGRVLQMRERLVSAFADRRGRLLLCKLCNQRQFLGRLHRSVNSFYIFLKFFGISDGA